MKKLLTVMMILCLAMTLIVSAFAATVTPVPAAMKDGEDGFTARVDVENGIGTKSITFTVYLDDEYRTNEIAALKAGDTIRSFDEDITVETVKPFDGGWDVNGGFFDGGATFCVTETDDNVCFSMGYDDLVVRHVGQTLTLPMADQVKVCTYRMEPDGSYNGAMDENTLSAADVRSFLLKKADVTQDDAISLDADFTVFVENNVVTEIHVNWAPNV